MILRVQRPKPPHKKANGSHDKILIAAAHIRFGDNTHKQTKKYLQRSDSVERSATAIFKHLILLQTD